MKKSNSKLLVWALLLSSFFSVSTELHAQVFGVDLGNAAENAKNIFNNAKDAAKKALEEANKKRAEEEKNNSSSSSSSPSSTSSVRTVNNSIVELQGNVALDIKWILFSITKGSFSEKITVAASNGSYKTNISLRDGAGVYAIQVFQNNKVDRYTSYSYLSASKVENTDERDMSFLLPSTMVQSDAPEIIALVKELTRNATSQREAVKAIHDYVATNVNYDYDSYRDGSYATKSFDALSILKRPLTVCSGYANLFAAMVRAYGVKVKVIHGKGVVRGGLEDHAWNEVLLDGEWRNVDSTWNSNIKSSKYFLMSDEVFNLDHQKEKELTDY